MSDAVAIFSGGLDSTVLVYEMRFLGYTPHLLSFNYGQRHVRELDFAAKTAKKLGLKHDVIDLSNITHLISNSALTSPRLPKYPTAADILDAQSEIEVPEGHYAEDNMKATVVPNRNMIMLSIAAGVAVNEGAEVIGTGVHAGDHFIYPDCRPEFIKAANAAIVRGNAGFAHFNESLGDPAVDPNSVEAIFAPFINATKADIAYRAIDLGVPFAETWSCYKGGDIHCGKCGTCVERLEAIDEAQKRWRERDTVTIAWPDTTTYEDNEYWREAVKNA